MPTYENRLSLHLGRLRLSLHLEASTARQEDATSGPQQEVSPTSSSQNAVAAGPQQQRRRELVRLRERLEERERELEGLRAQLARHKRDGAVTEEVGGIRPENIVWIFGTARTGSTWLSAMMGDLDGFVSWNEPLIGDIFGVPYYVRWPFLNENPDFALRNSTKDVWVRSIRSFTLEAANARFPDLDEGTYIAVQEPVGSIGAPLLVEALPESRMILLVRDPRDIASSLLSANRKGGWAKQQKKGTRQGQRLLAEKDPDAFIRQTASNLLTTLSRAEQAYDAHRGYKTVLRYEDLRYNTFAELRRVCSELRLPVGEERLQQVVDHHAWERVPEDQKGVGKHHRKAMPGGWKEDLTPQQAKAVEEINAPFLDRYYPERETSGV